MVNDKEKSLMSDVRMSLLRLKALSSISHAEELQLFKVLKEFKKLDDMIFD